MPSHPDLATAFRRGLRTGAPPPGLTASDPGEVARRFDVYRNNVAHGLSAALAARFPVVRRLVGEAFFGAMARVFLEAHPPASPVLLDWGGALPRFLEGFPPVAALPYLPDVARLELARGRAFHAADASPLSPQALALAAEDPSSARLALHPSVGLVASRFAVASIWRANQPGEAPAPIPAGPETALVLRDRTLEVRVHDASPGDAAFLDALRSGAALLEAAWAAARVQPGHEPGPLLSLLAGAGAILPPAPEVLP